MRMNKNVYNSNQIRAIETEWNNESKSENASECDNRRRSNTNRTSKNNDRQTRIVDNRIVIAVILLRLPFFSSNYKI